MRLQLDGTSLAAFLLTYVQLPLDAPTTGGMDSALLLGTRTGADQGAAVTIPSSLLLLLANSSIWTGGGGNWAGGIG